MKGLLSTRLFHLVVNCDSYALAQLNWGGIQYESSVLEEIPMGGYIISIFAQILGSLR